MTPITFDSHNVQNNSVPPPARRSALSDNEAPFYDQLFPGFTEDIFKMQIPEGGGPSP